MSQDSVQIIPWYKQPWLWFILTPILAAMTVGFIMLSVSITQQRIDPPLNKEFVRDGRGYAIDETMIENAKKLGLSANLKLDTETGEAILTMLGDLPANLSTLELHVKVGANHERDHVIQLHRLGNLPQFNGSLTHPITARSTFLLISPEGKWKLMLDARPPFENKVLAFIP
ncbi:hypothetical protein LH51_03615 [Nitrincola sp. A-D6]|uniref:FixH family protein n=1 Tax=Nitrincola sp. A-D6 TaxID=1545442 RepID=UPI00051FC00F|nr:FixH family protein [Nitrincola sp. A-D6]KGK42970.1 hypothetical protein LH51_03615 [Nitrincola sp. A-D6]